jgi:hypothetical protein
MELKHPLFLIVCSVILGGSGIAQAGDAGPGRPLANQPEIGEYRRTISRFTAEEDERLLALVQTQQLHGPAICWLAIAAQMPGRNARQCRDRYNNYINPTLDRTPILPPLQRRFVTQAWLFGHTLGHICRDLQRQMGVLRAAPDLRRWIIRHLPQEMALRFRPGRHIVPRPPLNFVPMQLQPPPAAPSPIPLPLPPPPQNDPTPPAAQGPVGELPNEWTMPDFDPFDPWGWDDGSFTM